EVGLLRQLAAGWLSGRPEPDAAARPVYGRWADHSEVLLPAGVRGIAGGRHRLRCASDGLSFGDVYECEGEGCDGVAFPLLDRGREEKKEPDKNPVLHDEEW